MPRTPLSASDPLLESNRHEYRTYKYRWLLLLSLCLTLTVSGVIWISFAPIAVPMALHYRVSEQAVNWLSMVFLAGYIPVSPLSMWILNEWQLRVGVLVGVALNVAGVWLRASSAFASLSLSGSFWLMFAGQSLAACGQPFILNAPTLMAAHWFAPSERATATMVASISNAVGAAVASVVVPFAIDTTKTTIVDIGQLHSFNVALAIATTAIGLLSVLVVRNRPPTPPSATAHAEASDATHTTASFVSDLKELARNKDYIFLVLAFGLGLGVFNALTTLMEQFLHPQGFTDDEAGAMAGAVIGAGLVGAFLSGPLVDYTKRFTPIARVGFAGATGAALWFAFQLQRADGHGSHFGLVLASLILIGFFAFVTLPPCLELSVECSFPVAESTSSGPLWTAGQVAGIALISLAKALPESGGTLTNATYMLAAAAGASTLLLCVFNGRYRRLEIERLERDVGKRFHVF